MTGVSEAVFFGDGCGLAGFSGIHDSVEPESHIEGREHLIVGESLGGEKV